ncbi:MAG: bifunctional shikimate kinase/3-dehydroquinate synthase [Myxococcales bacterium]|nr:bifunctional shikimate kinase/3-dehydroquinate synthase [Myxococcales bacterium]
MRADPGDARDVLCAAQRGPIWLVGMMGTGKSTVGRLLAERLGRRFIDLDQVIEGEAGRTVREIFADDGETAFRAREAEVAQRLGPASHDAVIATGGGTPCEGDTVRGMKAAGLVVWLRADVDDVMRRIDLSRRPLLAEAVDPRARWIDLAQAREARYRVADVTIERRGRQSADVADELASWLEAFGPFPLGCPMEVDELTVELGARRYPIYFDPLPGAEERFAAHLARRVPPGQAPIGVVTDETVARLHLPRYLVALQHRGYRVVPVTLPGGEESKSLANAGAVAEALAAGGLDRRSTVVALGGGVVCDLAGFVASVLYRGVACAHVPTTLLAQVDASVGGKTGVNLPSGKNLIGTFHQPLLVYADLTALATLDGREVASGLGEIAKHALLEGGPLWTLLEARAEEARAASPSLLAELVRASCRLKANVVAGDERELEPAGGRLLLNLGHTVGHALEIRSLGHRGASGSLRHGEAVGLGLIAAARVACALGGGDPDVEARVSTLIARLGLPTDLDPRLDAAALAAVAVDKKRALGDGGVSVIRYLVLDGPGRVRVEPLAPARLAELLRAPASPHHSIGRSHP